MSRGEFGGRATQSYGAIGGQYDSPRRSQAGSQDEFQKLSDAVSSNVFQINSNTSALERILRQISTRKDEVPQEKIHRLQQGTNKLAAQTTNILKNMSSLCGSSRQLRIQHERLKEEFRESISRYYSVQNKLAEQEKLIVKSASVKARRDEVTAPNFDSDRRHLIEDESKREADQQLLEQIAVDEAVMYEREDRIRQIEADILDINEIFRDLATMVYEQGEVIDSIESNVESAHANVGNANIQLEKASKYQKAARKKMCCLLVVLVVVAGALALILYFTLK